MNWLNDFLNDSKHNLPFEIPKEASEKLNSYVTLFKEKTNELKQTVSEQVKEFGSQTQMQTQMQTIPRESTLQQGKSVGNEGVTVNSQNSQRVSEEGKHHTTNAKMEQLKRDDTKEIFVRYKIRMRRTEGEIKLPKGSKEEAIKEAILEHSGFHMTTKLDTSGTDGGKSSSALTGFNSYASLFSKFK